MPKVKNIIWDWNGTLINDVAISCRILNEMLAERGLQSLSLEQFQRIYEHPAIRIYERAGFDLINESFELIAQDWHARYQHSAADIQLHHDSLMILDKCQRSGIDQYIISALPHDILTHNVKALQLESYFSFIKGLEDSYARSKIENAKNLMESMSLDPNSTIMIGDSAHDYETAKAINIDCLLVGRGYEHIDRLTQLNTRVINSFTECLTLLDLS